MSTNISEMESVLEWGGLTYKYISTVNRDAPAHETLLNRLTGEAYSGQVTAILGSVGSG